MNLVDLIRELVNDPPVNTCADDGTTCVFCCSPYNYNNALVGKPIVTHSPDCWLIRASAAISEAL